MFDAKRFQMMDLALSVNLVSGCSKSHVEDFSLAVESPL